MAVTGSELKDFSISKFFFISFVVLLSLKIFFASVLDLYSDEIFYWQASSLPAIAYSDLPFITALLAGIGSSLDSHSPLAVRTVFILIGSSIPILVYWLALPITNNKDALGSAFLSLCIPLLGFLGLLAVPDVPLVFFGILSIGFFERALRTNLMKFWLATGIFVALGLSTHYRFLLYPVSAILFLSIFKPVHTMSVEVSFRLLKGVPLGMLEMCSNSPYHVQPCSNMSTVSNLAIENITSFSFYVVS